MAGSGDQAELSRENAIGKPGYILVVDGAIPDDKGGAGFFIQRGQTGLQLLKAAATNAAAVVSIGTCASFGGLPAAKGPNGLSPTGAISIKTALDSFGRVQGQAIDQCIGLPTHCRGDCRHFDLLDSQS